MRLHAERGDADGERELTHVATCDEPRAEHEPGERQDEHVRVPRVVERLGAHDPHEHHYARSDDQGRTLVTDSSSSPDEAPQRDGVDQRCADGGACVVSEQPDRERQHVEEQRTEMVEGKLRRRPRRSHADERMVLGEHVTRSHRDHRPISQCDVAVEQAPSRGDDDQRNRRDGNDTAARRTATARARHVELSQCQGGARILLAGRRGSRAGTCSPTPRQSACAPGAPRAAAGPRSLS